MGINLIIASHKAYFAPAHTVVTTHQSIALAISICSSLTLYSISGEALMSTPAEQFSSAAKANFEANLALFT
ncbi:hypothetical protein QN360_18405, partial [Glaciimonas sp. CA11.2]|nr:hypothetical protein [Glaciimonas sp. CA11.2]